MRHNGKELLNDHADFERWVRDKARAWAGEALEDADDVEREMLKHPPTAYPTIIVWKGVRTFDYWYVYASDFSESA